MTPEKGAEIEARIRGELAAERLSDAATTAIRELGPQILGYLVVLCRDRDAGCDVFSQFSEELWKSIGTFRGESAFKTWAYRVAWHVAQAHLRDPYRRRAQPLRSEDASHVAALVRTTTHAFRKTDVKDRFARLRAQLDAEEQTLLILRIDRKMSWAEIREVLATKGEPIAESALRKRFERLKERLRTLMKEDGLLPE